MYPSARSSRAACLLAIILMAGTACSSDSAVLRGDTAPRSAAPTSAPAATAPSIATPSPTAVTVEPSAIVAEAEPARADDAEIEIASDVIVVTTAGGASDDFNSTEFTIRSAVSTNSDPLAYLNGEPELASSGNSAVIVELTIENLIHRSWTIYQSDLVLQSPTGDEYLTTTGINEHGTRETFSWGFGSRDAQDIRLVFETPQLVEDLADWHLLARGVWDNDNRLPLILPLEGPAYARSYPLSLASGATGEFKPAPGCRSSEPLATLVEQIDVTIDDEGHWRDWVAGREDTIRAGSGERLVAIELAISAQSPPAEHTQFCASSLLWEDFVLEADDFDAERVRSNLQDVEPLSTSTSRLVFKIPSETKKIRLLGGVDRSGLGSWDLLLPGEAGEPGVALIPDQSRQVSAAPLPPGLRPDELSSRVLAEGGASGVFLGAQVALSTMTATNADVDSFVSDRPELASRDRTYVVTEIDVTGTTETEWGLLDHHFVLVDPMGRPHGAINHYDEVGDDIVTADVDGRQNKRFQIVFETNGLVTDSAGWSLAIDNGDDIALMLPFDGDASPSGFPLALISGQAAAVGWSGCSSSLDLLVTAASVDVEGPNFYQTSGLNVSRVRPDQRSVVIDLELASPDDFPEFNSCSVLSFWPDFLLRVDGRQVAPLPYGFPTIEPSATLSVPLHYQIPEDSQNAELVFEGEVLAAWQLKNAGQVLEDFGAQDRDLQTVITLDETVLFGFGESTLQQIALAPLTRVANVVNSESTGDIEIIGHTDSIGDDASNEALSQARAEAVAAALVVAGVDQGRLIVSGLGESAPIAPNETDDGIDNPTGRAQNRRVEVIFSTQN